MGSTFQGIFPSKVAETEGLTDGSSPSKPCDKLERMSSDCQQGLERISVGIQLPPPPPPLRVPVYTGGSGVRESSPRATLPPSLPSVHSGMCLNHSLGLVASSLGQGTRTLPISMVGPIRGSLALGGLSLLLSGTPEGQACTPSSHDITVMR